MSGPVRFFDAKKTLKAFVGMLKKNTPINDQTKIEELDRIISEKDHAKQTKDLYKFMLYTYTERYSVQNRLCNQIYGHVEFLQRLSSDNNLQSLFLISQSSGKTFLGRSTRNFMIEQAARSSELISALITDPESPFYSFQKTFSTNFDENKRYSLLKNVLSEEKLDIEELKAMLLQESFLTEILLRHYQNTKDITQDIMNDSKNFINFKKNLEMSYQRKYEELEERLKMKMEEELKNRMRENEAYNKDENIEEKQNHTYEDLMISPANVPRKVQDLSDEVLIDDMQDDIQKDKEIELLRMRIKHLEQVVNDKETQLKTENQDYINSLAYTNNDVRDTIEKQLRKKIEAELTPKIYDELKPIIEKQILSQRNIDTNLKETIYNEILEALDKERLNAIDTHSHPDHYSSDDHFQSLSLADLTFEKAKDIFGKENDNEINNRLPDILASNVKYEQLRDLSSEEIDGEIQHKVVSQTIPEMTYERVREIFKNDFERELRNSLNNLSDISFNVIKETFRNDIEEEVVNIIKEDPYYYISREELRDPIVRIVKGLIIENTDDYFDDIDFKNNFHDKIKNVVEESPEKFIDFAKFKLIYKDQIREEFYNNPNLFLDYNDVRRLYNQHFESEIDNIISVTRKNLLNDINGIISKEPKTGISCQNEEAQIIVDNILHHMKSEWEYKSEIEKEKLEKSYTERISRIQEENEYNKQQLLDVISEYEDKCRLLIKKNSQYEEIQKNYDTEFKVILEKHRNEMETLKKNMTVRNEEFIEKELKPQLKDEITRELEINFHNEKRAELFREFERELRYDIERNLRNEIRLEVVEHYSSEINKLKDELKKLTSHSVKDEEYLREILTVKIKNELHDEIEKDVRKLLRYEMYNEIEEKVRNEHNQNTNKIEKEIELKYQKKLQMELEKQRKHIESEIRPILEAEIHQQSKNKHQVDVDRLRRIIYLEVENDIKEKYEEELRSQIEKVLRHKIKLEIEQSMRDEYNKKLKFEIDSLKSKLKAEIEKEIRDEQRNKEVRNPRIHKKKEVEVEYENSENDPHKKKKFREYYIKEFDGDNFESNVSFSDSFFKSKNTSAVMDDDSLRDLFHGVCKALGDLSHKYSYMEFVNKTRVLIDQINEIRKEYNYACSIYDFIRDLKNQLSYFTKLLNISEASLEKKKEEVDRIKKEECTEVWNNWAHDLFYKLAGRKFLSNSAEELRIAISHLTSVE